eukprot:219842_1
MENIKVIVRVRPPLRTEKKQCVEANETHSQIFVTKEDDQKDRFTFDHVAAHNTKQIEMMQLIGKPIADKYLSGYNATIFAYGQTGSGKTFTMKGCPPAENMGLMPNIFMYLFHQFEQTKADHKDLEYAVKCTCLEIYNASIRDLFDPTKRNLQIRETPNKKGFRVQNLSEISCASAEDCLRLVEMATKNRHTDATQMNKHSSRSHLIFTVIITRRQMIHDNRSRNPVKSRTSRLNLVDLAGSERQSRTNANGDRLQEAKYINKSLSTLALVVSAVAASRAFIPFRDSPLTMILKDSIGGNALTFMIANISPAASDIKETVSTLRFAANAKQIKNRATINADIHPSLEELRAENSKFVHIVQELTKKYKESEEQNVELHNRIEELQAQLTTKQQEIEQLKSTNHLDDDGNDLICNEEEAYDSDAKFWSWIDSCFETLSDLLMDELQEILDVRDELNEDQWHSLKQEIYKRLLADPSIFMNNKDCEIIVKLWDRLKRKKHKQWIGSVLQYGRKLNTSRFMEFMDELQLEELEKVRRTKMNAITKLKFNGNVLRPQHYKEFAILMRIRYREGSERMKDKIHKQMRADWKQIAKQTLNLYAM